MKYTVCIHVWLLGFFHTFIHECIKGALQMDLTRK